MPRLRSEMSNYTFISKKNQVLTCSLRWATKGCMEASDCRGRACGRLNAALAEKSAQARTETSKSKLHYGEGLEKIRENQEKLLQVPET